MSKLTVLLASTACLAAPGDAPRTGDQPGRPLAAVAGDYYFGDGLGVNCSLSLKAEGRFTFGWRGCLGVYDQNTGDAKVVDGHLILSPEKPNVREGFRGTSTDFLIVRWGDRSYLVPEADKQEFGNEVNQGGEPRESPHGRFYLRRGDWEKKVTGLPVVPKDWEALLLKKPLHGRVIEVLGDDRAKVDLGTESGVWKGMELWADTDGFGLVRVVDVEAKICVIATKYPDLDRIRFQKGQGVRSKVSVE
jgi:hypothetical protein